MLEIHCGFRVGRSCTDQIFNLRQLLEKVIRKISRSLLAYVDLEKVYDTVSRHAEAMGSAERESPFVEAF